jgi:hypothetical protein
MVACLKDDADTILGYSVIEGKRLHWVFVKRVWRKIGIGASLVPPFIDSVSHLTEIGKSILEKQKGVIFNPFL